MELLFTRFWAISAILGVIGGLLVWTFVIGAKISELLIEALSPIEQLEPVVSGPLSDILWNGAFAGFVAGLTLVIPYVLPFYIILAMIEDSGYLTRISVMLDQRNAQDGTARQGHHPPHPWLRLQCAGLLLLPHYGDTQAKVPGGVSCHDWFPARPNGRDFGPGGSLREHLVGDGTLRLRHSAHHHPRKDRLQSRAWRVGGAHHGDAQATTCLRRRSC